MGITRGTALVASVEEATRLTGQTKLEHLEADGDLEVDDLLLTASDAVYDRLDADGHRPDTLSNPEVFKRAVAWHFMALLAALGHVSVEDEDAQSVHDRFMGLSDRYYEQVRPRNTSGDESGRTTHGVPRVGNVHRRPLYGRDEFYGDLPRLR